MSKLQSFFLVLSLSASILCGHGQEKPSILSHEIAPHWYVFNKPGYVVKSDNNVPLTVKDFIPICKEEFGLSERDELRPIKGFPATSSGVAKYQQYYDGYEVEHAIVIVESRKNSITMISSYHVGKLDLNTSHPISEDEALLVALGAIHETLDWQDSIFVNGYCRDLEGNFDSIQYKNLLPKGELLVARKSGTIMNAENYRFAWRFYLSTVTHVYRVLVDANTGELFDVRDDTRNSINARGYDFGRVQTLYDGVQTMETYRFSILQPWTLQNSKGNQTFLNGYPINDTDNIWVIDASAPASTAHWIIWKIKDFYYDKFLNDSLTDNVLINAGIETMNGSYYNQLRNRISVGKLGDNWASTIDNEQVLAQLGKSAKNPIVIKGEYDVYDSQDGKFIVIE